MNDALSLEEARRTRQIRHRQAFDVEQALREKVKELKSVDDCMKDNDMQGQHPTERNLDKRRLHLEKSIIKHTTRWATIKQEEEMAQKRIQEEGEEDIKEINNRVLEMRRELNGLKGLNQSYQALYEAKCREVTLWHSRLSETCCCVNCTWKRKTKPMWKARPKRFFAGNRPIVILGDAKLCVSFYKINKMLM